MKNKNGYWYTLLVPLMITISLIGLSLREVSEKTYYFPLLTIGLYLLIEKNINRGLHRKKILKKIQFFEKNK